MSNEIKHLTNHDPEKWIMRFDEKGAIHVNPKYDHVGATSDGYHTFDELYKHRIVLFRIAGQYAYTVAGEFNAFHGDPHPIWKSKLHSDGSAYDGWFIAGIFSEPGKQITYHIPMSQWDAFESEIWPELEKAPEWDGHNSSDVLKRLAEL